MRKNLRNRGAVISLRSLAIAAAVWPTAHACAQVTMDGSNLSYSSNQNLGVLTAHSLGNTVFLSGLNRTVTYAGLAPRGAGATLDFWGNASGPDSTIGVNQSVFITGQAPGYIGPWLTVGGANLAVYDPAVGLRAMAVGNTVNDFATDISATGRHVKLLNNTPLSLTSSANVESLTLSGLAIASDVTLTAGTTITLSQGALMKTGYNAQTISGGTIVSGADQLIVGVNNNDSTAELTLASDLVVNAGGLVKVGNGTLNLASKITGVGDIYLRRGQTNLQGDRTGQGAGRTVFVEGRGVIEIDDAKSLGNYNLTLTQGGSLFVPAGGSYAGDITLGQGGGFFTSDGNFTISGVVKGLFRGASTFSFSNNMTLGGGATDIKPNEFNTYGLLTLSSGTLSLNKANGVTAYSGDIGLFGGSIKLLANDQLASSVQIATISGSTIDLNGHTQSLSYLGTSAGSQTKLGTGGVLTLIGTSLSNINAQGSITGAGKVVMRSIGQTLQGSDTFTGGLFVESGVTNLQNSRTITGGVTLRGGIMSASADNAMGAATNSINFDGGTWATSTMTSSAHLINVLAGGGVLDNGASTFSINGAIGGADGALHKRGAAQLNINSDLNFAGRVVADAGVVALGSAGRLLGQSGLQTTPTGSVTINSPTVAIAADQIASTASLYAGGGTLTYVNNSTAGANETAGALVPVSGATTVAISNAQVGAAALTFSTISPRGGGATINFTAPNLGTVNHFFIADQAEELMPPWVLANNAGFAKYTLLAGVVPLDAADYSADFVADANVKIAATPAAPLDDLSIASLTVNAPAAVAITQNPNTTLTVASGGIFKDGVQTLTLSGGSLTAATGKELIVHGNGGDVSISSAITGDISLAKSGTGKLKLNGAAANTYTGATYVSQGTLELSKTVSNAAIPGDVFINGGTLRLQASEQIADTATVTLNSGTFDLAGFNETIANFANNGGTFSASGGRLTVTSSHTATLSSGSTTIGSGQIVDATGLHITGGANTIAAGGLINVFRITPDGEVTGGLALNGVQPAITMGSSNTAPGTLALGGEVTVDATGIAKISTDAGGVKPGQVDLRGSRVFNINSETEINAKLIDGTLVKKGAAVLRLNGSGIAADVSVDEGSLEITSTAALGTGNAILNGGKITLIAAGSAQTFAGNIGVTKDGTIDLTRPLDNYSGSATGDFSIGSLAIGANQLTVTGRNGGSLKFTGASTLNGDASFNTAVPINLAGAISQNGGSFGITKVAGVAPLIISGSAANTFTGVTKVNSGDLELRKTAGANAIGGDLILGPGVNVRSYAANQIANSSNVSIATGATLDFLDSSDTIASVNVATGGTLRSGIGKLGVTSAFTVAGSASITPADALGDVNVSGVATLGNSSNVKHAVLAKSMAVTGQLEIGDNNFVIDYTGDSPLASIRSKIISGYGNSSPHGNGVGITSSAVRANSNLAIGYAEAADVLGLTGDATAPFLNQTADATTVLLRVTLSGDADLDGKVDFSDLVKVAQNYGTSADSTWSRGDFDYDGAVGFADLVTVAQHYGQSLPGIAAAPVGEFEGDLQAAFAAVPEPGVMGLIAVGGLSLARRRRRTNA